MVDPNAFMCIAKDLWVLPSQIAAIDRTGTPSRGNFIEIRFKGGETEEIFATDGELDIIWAMLTAKLGIKLSAGAEPTQSRSAEDARTQ